MNDHFLQFLHHQIEELKAQGLYKEERVITSPQGASIGLLGGRKALNFCANNYLGLANHPTVLRAASESLASHGFGLASVRFICGTQDIHKQLETVISNFLGTEDTLLYSSCFDANGGLFETLFQAEDAIISDALNHASIIDGIRLSKAQRFRYQNNDMQDLEAQLQASQSARYRIIATDGVFSMDGIIANLKEICRLAQAYQSLVMIDDCHAVGFLGKEGRGTHEYHQVMDQVDIITGTLGKALGGASGGYISGKKPIIDWLRQRSRPYLFSNTLAPSIVSASLAIFHLLEKEGPKLRHQLSENATYFRARMTEAGFQLRGNDHPIIPVMIGNAQITQQFAKEMLEEGVYVIGFSYPVVPQNQARIRTQISAAHSQSDLDQAIQAFIRIGKKMNVI